ncbi:MAG: DUF4129 domain-containing protein [Acidimicrobiales bacterium]
MTEPGTRAHTLGGLRWLIAPFAVALFVVLGLAVSSEDRQSFQAGDEFDESDPEPFGGRDGNTELTVPLADGDGAAVIGLDYDGGRADIRLGDGVPVAIPRSLDDGAPLSERAIPIPWTDDSPATDRGFRLTEDGDIEPANLDAAGQGQPVIRSVDPDLAEDSTGQPFSSGIDVLHSDGSYTEARYVGLADGTGRSPSLLITRVDPNGIRAPIAPGPDGRVALGDGVTLVVPVQADPDAPPIDAGAASADNRATEGEDRTAFDPARLLALLAVTAAAGALLYLLTRRRPREIDEEPFGPNFVATSGVPEDRFDEFVAMLAADHDPARAIRLAFSAAERGTGGLPPRITTETPFEWTERVLVKQHHLAIPLRSLSDRFARTRFAAEEPTIADRDAAVADLVQLNRLAKSANVSDPVVVAGSPADSSGLGRR